MARAAPEVHNKAAFAMCRMIGNAGRKQSGNDAAIDSNRPSDAITTLPLGFPPSSVDTPRWTHYGELLCKEVSWLNPR